MAKNESLNHQIPTWTLRIQASVIDQVLRFLFLAPFAGALNWRLFFFGEGDLLESWVKLFLAWGMYCLFQGLALYWTGATPGKALRGLRLVSREQSSRQGGGGVGNASLSLQSTQILVRLLVDELSFFFAFAPRALALFRFDRTHLSDWAAETRVICLESQGWVPRPRSSLALLLVVLGLYWGAKSFLGAPL